MPSFFVPGLEKLSLDSLVKLEGEEFHHLTRVTHRRTSEPVLLNSGKGILAWADVETVQAKSITLKITEVLEHKSPQTPYAIAFALLKNKHDELIVEKCTELGASVFFPFTSEHSVKLTSDNTLQRFERIALAAIKQCDNPWLPVITKPQEFSSVLVDIKAQGYTPIVCSERKPDQWLHHLKSEFVNKPCFLIGAEGGWSDAEFSILAEYQSITLGKLISRAETAAISISAQWLAYTNQFNTIGTTK